MKTALIYLREPRPKSAELSIPAQTERVRGSLGRARRTCYGVFIDDADAASLPLFDRPAWKQLAERLPDGGHVIAANVEMLFRDNDDWTACLDHFRQREVTLHVADAVYTAELAAMVPQMVALVRGCERFWRRERAILAAEKRKRYGRRHCNIAPLGFRWERNKNGTYRRARDEDERALMGVLLEARERKRTYRQLTRLLKKAGHAGASGRPLSKTSVFRRVRAEVGLRAIEARPKRRKRGKSSKIEKIPDGESTGEAGGDGGRTPSVK